MKVAFHCLSQFLFFFLDKIAMCFRAESQNSGIMGYKNSTRLLHTPFLDLDITLL